MSVTLTGGNQLTLTMSWSAQLAQTGAPPTVASSSWVQTLKFTNGSGAGQAIDFLSVIRTLAASGTDNIDLTSTLSDLVGTASVTCLTVRVFLIWLLSTTQTGPDGATTGTAASSILLGNGTNPAFTSAAPAGWIVSTSTFNVINGGFLCTGVANAGGFTVDSTHKVLKIVNNDSGNIATYAIQMWITM